MSTLPVSEPKTPVPPNRDYYGVDELALFRQWTRASFLQETGEQAPQWNPAMRIKRWYDSTAAARDPEEPYFYRSWALADGKPVYKAFAITCGEAATLNLPGSVTYRKRSVLPTQAYMTGPDGAVVTPVIPENLADTEEAQALAAAVSRDTGETWRAELQSDPYPFWIVWSGERRRLWNLVSVDRGEARNVGRLLEERSRQGADSPGKWEIRDGVLVWASSINRDTGEQDVRPPYAVPMRDLYADREQIVVGFGGLLQVKRIVAPPSVIMLPGDVELRDWLRPIVEGDRDYWLAVLSARK